MRMTLFVCVLLPLLIVSYVVMYRKTVTLKKTKYRLMKVKSNAECFLSFSFFLLILARSNYDHYARECNFGILKKNKNKTKKQKQNKKSPGCVFN